MNLHQHFCVQTFTTKSIVGMQHRDLYNVARGSLNRHVDGFAFRGAADVRVTIVDSRQRTNPAIQRSHISMFARLHGNLIHVTAHAFVSRVIIVDHLAGFLTTDADALRQTPGLDRISDGEVHDLGKTSRFFQLFIGLRFALRPKKSVCRGKIDIVLREFSGKAERKICRHDCAFHAAFAQKMGQHFFVGMPDVRRRVGVIDRRGDEKFFRHPRLKVMEQRTMRNCAM